MTVMDTDFDPTCVCGHGEGAHDMLGGSQGQCFGFHLADARGKFAAREIRPARDPEGRSHGYRDCTCVVFVVAP